MDFREYIGFSPTSENVTRKEPVIRPIGQSSYSDASDNKSKLFMHILMLLETVLDMRIKV